MFEMKDSYLSKKSKRGTIFIENESGEPVAKVCTKCNTLTELDGFGKRSNGVCGRTSHCKECRKPYFSNYREEHVEEIKEYMDSNYERRLENNRNRYNRSADVRKRQAAFTRSWRSRNSKHVHEQRKKYKAENAERIKEYDKQYELEHAEARRNRGRNRRVRLKKLPCTLSFKDVQELKELQNHQCIISGIGECTDLATKKNQLSVDHFIPVNWGVGGHTYENCYYMYLPLNKSKRDFNPFEWIETQPEEYQERFHTILVPMLAERNGMSVSEFTAYVFQCEQAYLNNKEAE